MDGPIANQVMLIIEVACAITITIVQQFMFKLVLMFTTCVLLMKTVFLFGIKGLPTFFLFEDLHVGFTNVLIMA